MSLKFVKQESKVINENSSTDACLKNYNPENNIKINQITKAQARLI